MVVINSYSIAVIMCVITMICWGSWANTQKMVGHKNWPVQLFYWDYVIGLFLLSLLLAFTMGSYGPANEGRTFIEDLLQAKGNALLSAFIGGVIFNASNILLVIAIEIAGLSVAFPVGVGLALVLGVITNYEPATVTRPTLLLIGVTLVLAAIFLSAIAYKNLHKKTQSKNQSKNQNKNRNRNQNYNQRPTTPNTGSSKENSKKVLKGLMISLFAGALMGTFFHFIMESIGTTDYARLIPGKLGPYTAMVVFSLAILLSNFIWNSLNMYWPIVGKPCKYSDYFSGASGANVATHSVGILGGVIWGVGTSFSIIASGAAGAAISWGLGQGATMVAAIWGVFIWKEFKGASSCTNKMIGLMFVSYVVGLTLIIISKGANG
ncbi:MAG: multidrug DMT transporter permease [Oligoflexia bacterium]|nr:multidrug DMT transporter permease [Oligoflexia bacterium]